MRRQGGEDSGEDTGEDRGEDATPAWMPCGHRCPLLCRGLLPQSPERRCPKCYPTRRPQCGDDTARGAATTMRRRRSDDDGAAGPSLHLACTFPHTYPRPLNQVPSTTPLQSRCP